MTLDEILSQVQELLQREQQVSYRGLKRRFTLDDAYPEDLKEESIVSKRIITDEERRFLVCTGTSLNRTTRQSHSAANPPALRATPFFKGGVLFPPLEKGG